MRKQKNVQLLLLQITVLRSISIIYPWSDTGKRCQSRGGRSLCTGRHLIIEFENADAGNVCVWPFRGGFHIRVQGLWERPLSVVTSRHFQRQWLEKSITNGTEQCGHTSSRNSIFSNYHSFRKKDKWTRDVNAS